MFNKLRLNLVLLNAAVLALFVIAVIVSVWLVANKSIQRMTDAGIKNLALQTAELEEIPLLIQESINSYDEFPGAGQVLIVIWDENLDLTAVSSEEETGAALIKELAVKAQQEDREIWESLSIDNGYIRVYSLPFNHDVNSGVVQTAVDMSGVIYFLNGFITNLFLLALIFVVIAVLLAWFLAGRALVPIRVSWQHQEDFVADASHELRTPLTVFQTNLDVVLANPDQNVSENMKWLENAYSETEHMNRLINDLLLLAQIDKREAEMSKQQINVSALAADIAEQLEPLAHNNGLIFKWEIETNLNLCGDKGRLRQLLMILLDNAFKYTPEFGQVTLELKSNKDRVEITVADCGIGISPEEQKRIFDRFYRVDKARSRSLGGTGLGLAIALWIVRAHLGTIEVESNLGEGSKFVVLLPQSR